MCFEELTVSFISFSDAGPYYQFQINLLDSDLDP